MILIVWRKEDQQNIYSKQSKSWHNTTIH